MARSILPGEATGSPGRSDAARKSAGVIRALSSNGSWLYPLVPAAGAAVIWEAAAANSSSVTIPTFSATATAFVELLADPELWEALWISNQALIVGFGISAIMGVILGLATGRYWVAERILRPYLNILLVTPMAVIIPLLIMFTGLGLTSRVILIVASSLVIIVVNAQAGVKQAEHALVEMARSFGASELQIWRRVLLPGALPAVMAGIRLGLSQAVQAMVLIELLMVAVGLGELMISFRGQFESASLWAVVLIIVMESLLLVRLAQWLERRTAPWGTRRGRSM